MEPADIRVIIPVGGEAKRLKPLTADVSKAVVRIFNRPLVEFALAELALQNIQNFIFGVKGYVNYKSLYDYFKDGAGFSAQYNLSPRAHIKYQPHVDDVGNADSVRINMAYYDVNGPVIVAQGDNIFQLDLKDILSFHEGKQGVMTVVLTYVEDVRGYGIADIDGDQRLRGFVEKPKKEEAPSNLASTGIYVLDSKVKEVFNHPAVQGMIRRGRLDFGLDFIPFLLAEGYAVHGYVLKGEWYDVGTPRGYLDTVKRVLQSSAKSLFYLGEPVPSLGRVWIQGQSPESVKKREAIVMKVQAGKVRLEGSVVIGRHCQIGDGSIIKDSCIDNYCIIGEDVVIERSAVMDRVVIEDGAEIHDSIVGRYVRVKSSKPHPTWIVGVSVVGDDTVIGEGCFMTSTKIFPHKIISDGRKLVNETVE